MIIDSPPYTWFGANTALFHLINDVKQPWLNAFMLLGSALGAQTLIILYGPLFAAIALFVTRKHLKAPRFTAVTLWLAALFTFGLSFFLENALLSTLKSLVQLPSPAALLGANAVKLLSSASFNDTFPGSQAALVGVLAASVWPVLSRRFKCLAFLIAGWVSLSPIYAGTCFPDESLACLLGAMTIVWLVRRLAMPVIARAVVWYAGKMALRARLS